MASDAERHLAENVVQLFLDRDDMVVGITAALLDIYRNQMQMTGRHKNHIIDCLQAQLDDCKKYPGQLGVQFLGSLIASVRDEKLDAAKLLREPPLGNA